MAENRDDPPDEAVGSQLESPVLRTGVASVIRSRPAISVAPATGLFVRIVIVTVLPGSTCIDR